MGPNTVVSPLPGELHWQSPAQLLEVRSFVWELQGRESAHQQNWTQPNPTKSRSDLPESAFSAREWRPVRPFHLALLQPEPSQPRILNSGSISLVIGVSRTQSEWTLMQCGTHGFSTTSSDLLWYAGSEGTNERRRELNRVPSCWVPTHQHEPTKFNAVGASKRDRRRRVGAKKGECELGVVSSRGKETSDCRMDRWVVICLRTALGKPVRRNATECDGEQKRAGRALGRMKTWVGMPLIRYRCLFGR